MVRVAVGAVVLISGLAVSDPQDDYRTAAGGGALALALQLLFIAVLTPIGGEFALCAVLVNAVRRYGAVVSVVVSTLVFALVHGINLALVPAIVVGAIAAILLLRIGSVWRQVPAT
jgi:uncharacterized protein